jgi:hypothetical protein
MLPAPDLQNQVSVRLKKIPLHQEKDARSISNPGGCTIVIPSNPVEEILYAISCYDPWRILSRRYMRSLVRKFSGCASNSIPLTTLLKAFRRFKAVLKHSPLPPLSGFSLLRLLQREVCGSVVLALCNFLKILLFNASRIEFPEIGDIIR